MEGKPSPHLKKVLKSYQLSAANTMSGPSSIMSRLENNTGPGGIISRNRNGSFDGATDSIKDLIHQSFKQHPHKPPPVFSRSLNLGIGTQSNPLSKVAIINGIKQEPGGQGLPNTKRTGFELCDVGSTLIIKSTAQQLPPPILSTPDRAKPEKRETLLEGELISCFPVGGEKRLCFPQILNTVLHGFLLPQINQVCDELQIFCSRCSTEQLDVLKKTKVIPASANSCGLITKTDAERLVNSLLHRNPPKAAMSVLSAVNRPQDPNKPQPNSHFRISHYCFGKGKGVVLPHLYEKPDSLCIECVDCHGLFSPQRFVCHSHHLQENKTCHWGFDSTKWRHYVMVAKDQDNREKLEKALDDFKARFDRKRKESSDSLEECYGVALGEDRVMIKRVRYSTDSSSVASSPSSPSPYLSSPTSISILPSKKRLSFLQQSDNDNDTHQHHGVSQYELEVIKKIVAGSMGREGAELVNGYLERLARKVLSLEQICLNQEKVLRGITEKTSPGVELQVKVKTMEAESHSMKKHILRRHGEEVI